MIRIGTRGSKLAIIQAEIVKEELLKNDQSLTIEIVKIITQGDEQTILFNQGIGVENNNNKKSFTKAIENELIDGNIDIAVHSAKDLSVIMDDRLQLSATVIRGSPYDCLISMNNYVIKNLPQNAKIGTSSIRRRLNLEYIRPDLQIELLRGNIDSRITKLIEGRFDAIILARSGVERLNLLEKSQKLFFNNIDISELIPSSNQGTIAMQTRVRDGEINTICKQINCQKTWIRTKIERAVVRILNANCNTPLAVFASEVDENGQCRVYVSYIHQEDGILIKKKYSQLILVDSFLQLSQKAIEDLQYIASQIEL